MAHVPRNIQAPYVAADFWTQWGSATPRVCVCVKITPKDSFGGSSEAIGLTSNTRDMTLPGHVGITFKSTPGVSPSAVESALDNPSSLEMQGIYQTGIFEQSDVMAGKWSFAEIEVFSVSWQNVNLGELLHFRGNLGDFADYGTYFQAEGRGLLARLSNDVDWVTQRTCRHPVFGGTGCNKDLNDTVTIDSVTYPIRLTGLVTSGSEVIPRSEFTNIPPDGLYANGIFTYTSGPNSGVSREIASNHDVGPGFEDWVEFYLKRPFPFSAEFGDTATIILGCNRTVEDCIKFDNIINRSAEDWIPGIEAVRRVPTAN